MDILLGAIGVWLDNIDIVTALLQTLVRGSAEPSLGPMYIDVSFPRPSSSPRLGILVHWLPIDSVLLTEPLQISY